MFPIFVLGVLEKVFERLILIEVRLLVGFEEVAKRVYPNSKVSQWWKLEGGSSARVLALELALPNGSSKRVVIREYGERDVAGNPSVAVNEYRLLELLSSEGVAVPKPYYVDEDYPYMVIEYIEGKTEFAPLDLDDYLSRLVGELVKTHNIDASKVGFLPGLELEGSNPAVILHGDFWPGNVLFREKELVALIDWEDAMVGDPLFDLANARLEIMWAFGFDAMETFTSMYSSMKSVDIGFLAEWDIHIAKRKDPSLWGLDSATEARMQKEMKEFVGSAEERRKRDGKI